MYTFFNLWQRKQISDQQCALHFFLHDYLRKYPNKRLQARYATGDLQADVLYQFNFKKVKGKAIDALYHYLRGLWPCLLFTHSLSPYEVLRIQAQGIRPLSLMMQTSFRAVEHKVDGFEFFVHDLEHAYMFFFDAQRYQIQCLFFQRLLQSIDEGVWRHLLQDSKFKSKFEYLMSDMNTHIQHYYFYLRAIVPLDSFHHYEFLFKDLIDINQA